MGRAASTPVALVRWGTKTVQEVLVSTLEHVVEDVAKAQLKAPAIIVVGDVVNLVKNYNGLIINLYSAKLS